VLAAVGGGGGREGRRGGIFEEKEWCMRKYGAIP